MSTQLLHKAYNPEVFQKEGQDLLQLLSCQLEDALRPDGTPTINWHTPDDEYAFWKEYITSDHNLNEFFRQVTERSVHVHNPKYIGHQVAPTVPVSALATLLSAHLNNGSAVYEMGMSNTALERLVIEFFNNAMGWSNGSGFLTSGGTLANLTSLLAARKVKAGTDVWTEGHQGPLAIMVSEEAHYCVDRAARIMGLGDAGIIKVPVGEDFSIRTDLLENYYQEATDKGLEVIAVIGSAPSTSTGAYDDLSSLGSFSKKHNLWFHIDGAHGGAAIFSEKYRSLMKGAELADSLIIDGHKMMGTSAITTAVLFRNAAHSYDTFNQQAQYLWGENDAPDWFNMGKRTFECTKSMMSLRFFSILMSYGEQFFDDFVTSLYDSGKAFAEMVQDHPQFELALQPMSNIVCFRYKGTLSLNELDQTNKKIRQALLEDGEYYIVSTFLKQDFYLRTTFMNPFTSSEHMQGLLDKILEHVSVNA